MRWLFDTNVFIDAYAGEPRASKAILVAREKNPEWVGFSAMSRLEVLGCVGLTPADEVGLRRMLDQFPEVPIDSAIIEKAIRIRQEVRIKSPDAIIAATALLSDAELVTRNVEDFKRVLGLKLIDTNAI